LHGKIGGFWMALTEDCETSLLLSAPDHKSWDFWQWNLDFNPSLTSVCYISKTNSKAMPLGAQTMTQWCRHFGRLQVLSSHYSFGCESWRLNF
jgi:hypothetical protein